MAELRALRVDPGPGPRAGLKVERIDLGRTNDIRHVAWRPDGARALVVGNQGSAGLWDGGQTWWLEGAGFDNLRGCDWTPDGEEAIVVGNSGAILRLASGRLTRVPFFSPVALRRVVWSPSGDLALVVGNDGLVLEIARSGQPKSAGFGEAHLRGIAWLPGGSAAVVFANGGIHLFEHGKGDLTRLHREERGDLIAGLVDPVSETVWACGFRSEQAAQDRRMAIVLTGRIGGAFEDAATPVRDLVWTGIARLGDGSTAVVGDSGETGEQNQVAVLGAGGQAEILAGLGAFHPAGIAARPASNAEPLQGIEALVFGSPRSRFFRA